MVNLVLSGLDKREAVAVPVIVPHASAWITSPSTQTALWLSSEYLDHRNFVVLAVGCADGARTDTVQISRSELHALTRAATTGGASVEECGASRCVIDRAHRRAWTA